MVLQVPAQAVEAVACEVPEGRVREVARGPGPPAAPAVGSGRPGSGLGSQGSPQAGCRGKLQYSAPAGRGCRGTAQAQTFTISCWKQEARQAWEAGQAGTQGRLAPRPCRPPAGRAPRRPPAGRWPGRAAPPGPGPPAGCRSHCRAASDLGPPRPPGPSWPCIGCRGSRAGAVGPVGRDRQSCGGPSAVGPVTGTCGAPTAHLSDGDGGLGAGPDAEALVLQEG